MAILKIITLKMDGVVSVYVRRLKAGKPEEVLNCFSLM